VFLFLNICEEFLILRKFQRDITTSVYSSSRKVLVILVII